MTTTGTRDRTDLAQARELVIHAAFCAARSEPGRGPLALRYDAERILLDSSDDRLRCRGAAVVRAAIGRFDDLYDGRYGRLDAATTGHALRVLRCAHRAMAAAEVAAMDRRPTPVEVVRAIYAGRGSRRTPAPGPLTVLRAALAGRQRAA